MNERGDICTRAKHPDGRERPHFVRLSAAQKVVGSLPPAPSCSGRVLSARRDRSKQFVMQVVLHRKREKEENRCHY